MTRGDPLPPETRCEREPIHVPGHVQPHGAMLALALDSLEVVQVSRNIEDVVGGAAEAWLGASIEGRLPASIVERLRRCAGPERGARTDDPQLVGSEDLGPGRVDVIAHVRGEHLVVELEPVPPSAWRSAFERVASELRGLGGEGTLRGYADRLTQAVRRVTGYDRVMLYRFAPEGHGWVYAEARRDDLEPFLDLHYPASDIPSQARRLFALNRTRLLVDRAYTPAPMVPAELPGGGRLDMSHCFLRGVSPVHLEYLANMGVRATLSLALTRGAEGSTTHPPELFALIACHHYDGPKHLPHAGRAACEILAQSAAMRVSELEAREDSAESERASGAYLEIVRRLAARDRVEEGVESATPALAELFEGASFASAIDGTIRAEDPALAPHLARVVDMLERAPREVRATDHLREQLPELSAETVSAMAGLLAVPFPHRERTWLLWTRPEQAREVKWAGDPTKPVKVGPLGARLTPRESFALWRQTVEGRSAPWAEREVRRAERLEAALGDVVYRERERLVLLNAALEVRNRELDSFSTMASHDLREPLRAIASYATFLREDAQPSLTGDASAHLESIERLVRRMYGLIEGLMEFSRVGRREADAHPVDFRAVLDEVLEDLEGRVAETGAEIVVRDPLPRVPTWEVGVREVFANLVGNALKYAEGAPHIEIGVTDPRASGAPPEVPKEAEVVYVSDRGIGIAPDHHEGVFALFHRVHRSGEYGGGTGTGLPIVRKIVERLGGRVWLRSALGEGSTFYFTFPPREVS